MPSPPNSSSSSSSAASSSSNDASPVSMSNMVAPASVQTSSSSEGGKAPKKRKSNEESEVGNKRAKLRDNVDELMGTPLFQEALERYKAAQAAVIPKLQAVKVPNAWTKLSKSPDPLLVAPHLEDIECEFREALESNNRRFMDILPTLFENSTVLYQKAVSARTEYPKHAQQGWAFFKKIVLSHYAYKLRKDKILKRLLGLRPHYKAESISLNYINEFITLRDQIKKCPEWVQRVAFKENLPDYVLEKLEELDNSKKSPPTIQEYQDKLETITWKKPNQSSPPQPKQRRKVKQPSSFKDFTKNKCLRCGHTKHTTDECFARQDWVDKWIATLKDKGFNPPKATTNAPKPRVNKNTSAYVRLRTVKPLKAIQHYKHSFDGNRKRHLKQREHLARNSGENMVLLLPVEGINPENSKIKPYECNSFIDNGATFNAVSTSYVKRLKLKTKRHANRQFRVKLGGGKEMAMDRVTTTLYITMPGIGTYETDCIVMDDIPEECEILLGMPFLTCVNPYINWRTGTIQPDLAVTQRSETDARLRYHRHVPLYTDAGETKVIKLAQLYRELRKKKSNKDTILFRIQQSDLAEMTKKERQEKQTWETLTTHPFYDMLCQFKDTVFDEKIPVKDLDTEIEHEIKLKTPKVESTRQYRLSPEQNKAVQAWVEEMLENGMIQPSTSPYNSPILVIKKPNGKYRIVHDYRLINANTLVPQYPIMHREDIIARMAGSYWFTSMDLKNGYYQLRMKESDRPITAFSTPFGHFEYLVMAQGLSGAPATFNRFVQKQFADLENAQAYFDDIFVHTSSKDLNDHEKALHAVLKRLEERNLRISLAKCIFASDEIPVLGDLVGRNGVRMDPEKIEILKNWPVPQTRKDLKSFLGTTVYNARFCKEYGTLSAPLHEATKSKKKNEEIELTAEQLSSFHKLKEAMITAPVLGIADHSLPFGVRTDASNFAIGGVLFNILPDGTERVIAYYGRKMTDAELNYDVRETELLGALHACRIWRPYLLDKPFVVETDHKALTSLLTKPQCSRRMARWLNELAEYPIEFRWIPGETNTTADGLSRHPTFEAATPKASVVPLRDFLQSLLDSFDIDEDETDACYFMHDYLYTLNELNPEIIRDLCRTHLSDDAELAKIVHARTTTDTTSSSKEGRAKGKNKNPKNIEPVFKKYHYTENEGLVYFTGNPGLKRLCVPRVKPLIEKVLYLCHDLPIVGHVGLQKTLYNVRQKFYWKGMDDDIKRYVQTCEKCQRTTHRTRRPAGLLNPTEIATQRKANITMDFLSGIPRTKNGFDAIWVICDRLTKRTTLIPSKKTDTAQSHAVRFFNEYVRYHGLPLEIISDRDTTFQAAFWQQLMRIYGIKPSMSTAFRPQTDGQTERINQVIAKYLATQCTAIQDDWDEKISAMEIAINTNQHKTLRMSPYEADTGYPMRTPLDSMIPHDGVDEPAKSFADEMKQLHLKLQSDLIRLQEQIALTQHEMQRSYNRNRPEQKFKPGDFVLLDTRNLSLAHLGMSDESKRKISPKFIGPYKVLKETTPDTYELELPAGLRLHNKFHTSLLKPYHKDDSPTRQNIPHEGLQNREGEQSFIVEKIMDADPKTKRVLVRWLGYTESDDSWIPIGNIDSAIGLVLQYFEQHPEKRFHIPKKLLKGRKTTNSRVRRTRRNRN